MGSTESMRMDASLLARDPFRLSSARRDLAVQAHGKLGGDERAARQAMLDIELVEPARPLLEDTDDDLDAGAFQHSQPGASDAFIRIDHRDDDAPYARVDHRMGT